MQEENKKWRVVINSRHKYFAQILTLFRKRYIMLVIHNWSVSFINVKEAAKQFAEYLNARLKKQLKM